MTLVSEEKKQEIEKIIKWLTGKSLSEIATENNIFYTETNLSDIAEWVSGLIIYNWKENRFWILIEQSDHPNRKRFTFAHELWHFFLHSRLLKEKNKVFIDTDNSYAFFRLSNINVKDEDKPLEAEANYFAAELLMPKNVINDAYNKIGNIEILSMIFKVSKEAIENRLSNLGLIKKKNA